MTLIDLSRVIYAGMPKIPILPDVEIHKVTSMADGAPLNIGAMTIAFHCGTHIDAPVHIVPNGRTIEQMPLEIFAGWATVIPVQRGGGERITLDDIRNAPTAPQSGDIVFFHTGWDAKFESPDYNVHPYFDEAAAEWLVNNGTKLMGIDCITVDQPVSLRPPGFGFPIHHILLEHEVLIGENLANLGAVSGQRVRVYAFPLPIRRGDAGHARIVAEI